MAPYTPTTYVNGTTPAINATDLNHLTNELVAQAAIKGVSTFLTTNYWVNGSTHAVSDGAPLNEMERVAQLVATSLSLSYTPTAWSTGWSPPRNATNLNKLEQQARANRVVIDGVPPSTAYFIEDWSSGQFAQPNWELLFSYTAPGWTNLPAVQSPDGRVAVVNDPAGGGGKCARVEIRDTDPDWGAGPGLSKSEIDTGNSTRTWNGSFTAGTIRWFEWDIYLPYVVGGEIFDYPRPGPSGGEYWSLFGLHPPAGSPASWSAMHLEWNPFQFHAGGDSAGYNNISLNWHAEGGTWNGGNAQPTDANYRLLPLTDGSGNRVLANHNRWIHLIWGVKFNPDNTGWLEIWIDGVNVLPRVNRPTCWDVDITNPQSYFKYGIYTHSDSTFPANGRSVAYYGRTTIGVNRPF